MIAVTRFQCLAMQEYEVIRYSGYVEEGYGRQGAHDVNIYDQDGQFVANVGGYASPQDMQCGGNWYKRFVERTDVIGKDYIKIPLMLAAEPLRIFETSGTQIVSHSTYQMILKEIRSL
jgi:hypothetical protein